MANAFQRALPVTRSRRYCRCQVFGALLEVLLRPRRVREPAVCGE